MSNTAENVHVKIAGVQSPAYGTPKSVLVVDGNSRLVFVNPAPAASVPASSTQTQVVSFSY